jgi:multicomponent Na+:H+ antiporter subunit E
MPGIQERTRRKLLPAPGVTLVLRGLSGTIAKSHPRRWRRTNDSAAPFEPFWMTMYRYSRSRRRPKMDLKLQIPNATLPSGSVLIKQAEPVPPDAPKLGNAMRRRSRASSMSEYSGRPDEPARNASRGRWSSAALRAAGFGCLWLVLSGAQVGDIPAAVAAVVAATWTSLYFLEPSSARRSLPAVARLVLLFLYHSVVAGLDVAGRALNPRLPLHPGFLAYPTQLSRGVRQNVFTTLTSLLPGTVPAGEESGHIIYHCLDITQPVLADLAAEEAALVRALYND